MKVLIVGSDKINAIENFYTRYLRQLGVDVHEFCAYDMFLKFYQHSLLNKMVFKAGLSSIYKSINRQFLQAVETVKPNVILVFKGMELYPSSLQHAASQHIRLANYNPDNPFVFSGSGSGNKNVTDSIPFYDLHLTYHPGVAALLEKDLHMKVEILPFGFYADEAAYVQCVNQQEVLKACFVGNPDKPRAAFLEALAQEGIPIDIYGSGWKNFLQHENIAILPATMGLETWKALRRYRVQLNIMRPHNEDSHNMRTFEVPGIGGIMVAPDNQDHRKYFKDKEEVFFYQDARNAAKIVKDILSMEKGAAEEIRRRARLRSVNSGYSYEDRAKMLLGYLQSLQVPA